MVVRCMRTHSLRMWAWIACDTTVSKCCRTAVVGFGGGWAVGVFAQESLRVLGGGLTEASGAVVDIGFGLIRGAAANCSLLSRCRGLSPWQFPIRVFFALVLTIF